MVADLTAAHPDPQGKITAVQHLTNSKAQRRTGAATVSAEHVMATAPLASRCRPVRSQCLLEHMLEIELEEAKTADNKIYHSIVAPTAAPAAVVSKRPEAVPERAASSHHPESTTVSGAPPDISPKRTQQSAQKVSVSKAASKDGTYNLSQPMACDRSLQHLPPPEGAEQAPSQHSSASQDAPQGAASNAERSSSSSIAGGAALQDTAAPQRTRLSSDKQAAGSHGSPGSVLSPARPLMCLFSSI